MKVILKGGNSENNEKIKKFFMENILPILKFGIAIEPSSSVITVYEHLKNGKIKEYIDPTAEVIVELPEEAKILARNTTATNESLHQKSAEFFEEALAIREIERLRPPFSVEYYSCRYTPSSREEPDLECEVHGSIEHMQSSDGKCPGCGKR